MNAYEIELRKVYREHFIYVAEKAAADAIQKVVAAKLEAERLAMIVARLKAGEDPGEAL